ncbi:fibronectin type III domain-containing protein [Actinophytocola sediminis]
MSKRSRLLAWFAGAALLVGAVVVLRAPESTPDDERGPVVAERFAEDLVVLPGPSQPPQQPPRIVVEADTSRLRVSWADGLIGGQALPGVVGYEVGWQRIDGEGRAGSRLVVAPDMLLDGLVDGERYRVWVRSVDAYGQRSAPTEATGQPEAGTAAPLLGLTEIYDDFADPSTIAPNSPRSRWHQSGDRGCVRMGADRGLAIDFRCGSDIAVLRARTALRLGGDRELGRVAVLTDAAGPGGELIVDLVPGPADRVGVGTRRTTEHRDPGLPGGTIRVSISDGGVLVSVAPDLPATAETAAYQQVPRRGPGVAHLFEVALTTSGVRVYQDGLAVAVRQVVPPWRQASVLLGFRGPDDRPSRVRVAAVGLSGPAHPATGVVEAVLRPATKRILDLDEAAPDGEVARWPLVESKSARVVVTVAMNPELVVGQAIVQLGTARLPARPVVPGLPSARGASLTLVADVPSSLLGPSDAATIAPFVVRAPGADTTAIVVEAYLEITPTPAWAEPAPTPAPAAPDTPDGQPTVTLTLADAAGEPLPSRRLPAFGQVVLTVRLDAAAAQWDTGAVAGVQGLEVYLDGKLIAAMPTDADGPGVGGSYALPIALGGIRPGDHAIEVKQYGTKRESQSARVDFTVER